MNVFISVGMEGNTVITSPEDVMPGEPEYERGTDMLHGDVNAAIEGAFVGGASDVLVNDAHYHMRNLDPAAVALGFWTYGGGSYYGVPLSNFVGWIVSATITVSVFDWDFELTAVRTRLQQCDFMLDTLVSFVILWGVVNAYFGNLVPVAIAGLFGVRLLKSNHFGGCVD